MRFLFAFMIGAMIAATCSAPPLAESQPPSPARVLVFTKTAGFRHDSIPAGIEAVKNLGREHRFEVDAIEDASAFTDDNLRRFAAIVFLNTSGDVLNDEQQPAMEKFIRAGGGFVGVHAATDTEHDWEWYGRLVGARFKGHPEVQPATIRVLDGAHPSMRHLPREWRRTDEWYDFDKHPRERIGKSLIMLATLDASTYKGGEMGADHPFAWCHEFDGGRAWYTAGGHTIESYREPAFLKHLLGGIQWAAKFETVNPGAQSEP